MPGFNGRGPLNEGPMTGRRLGRCTANDASDYGPGFGAGFHGGGYGYRAWGGHRNWNGGGAGRGRGFGYRANFYHRGTGYGARRNDAEYPETEVPGQSSTATQADINRKLTHILDQLSEWLRHGTGQQEVADETK